MRKAFRVESPQITCAQIDSAQITPLDSLTRDALRASGNPDLAAMASSDPDEAKKAVREYARRRLSV